MVPVAYAAFPWCANSGKETVKRLTTTKKIIVSLLFVAALQVPARTNSLLYQEQSYLTIWIRS